MLLGNLDSWLRKNLLSERKYYKYLCFYSRTQLGVLIETRNLTLNILEYERKSLATTMLTTHHSSRKRLMLCKVAYLLGLVVKLYLTLQSVKRSCTALTHVVLLTLKFNSSALFSSGKFKHLTDLLEPKTLTLRTYASPKPTRPCGTPKIILTLKIYEGWGRPPIQNGLVTNGLPLGILSQVRHLLRLRLYRPRIHLFNRVRSMLPRT